MANNQTTTPGSAPVAPKPQTEERFKPATKEDIEKCQRLFQKDYDWIRVDKDGKQLDKDFFWKIVSLHKTIPAGEVAVNKFYMTFGLQKFHRDKFVEIRQSNGGVDRKYQPAKGFEMPDPENDVAPVEVDSWASMHMRDEDFFKNFRREDETKP